MPIEWTERLSAPVEAAEHGVAEADQRFSSTHTGPLNFDRIDYPAAQTYVETFERAGQTDWTFSIATTLYFRWDRDSTFVDTIVHPLASVIEETLAAFDATYCIGNYHPARIDFFSGEPTGDLVLAVSVQFQVTTLLDPGEFA